MGRPQKQTADYFPHFVRDADTDRVLYILENSFQSSGYAFYYRLRELLCVSQGHFYNCSMNAEWIYFTAKMKASPEDAKAMLDLLAQLGEIDNELWTDGKIIWWQSLVDSLSHLYSKRSQQVPKKPVLEFPAPETGFPRRISPETPISGAESTQSKVKKRKEKNKESSPPSGGTHTLGTAGEDLEVQTASGAAEAADLPTTPKAKPQGDPPGFAEFWTLYPRKAGKGDARKAWKKLRPDKELLRVILEAVRRQKEAPQWQEDGGRFIPYPATWLNRESWEDEVESPSPVDPWEEDEQREVLPDQPVGVDERLTLQDLMR